MADAITQTYHIMQIMQIMNQLRRLASEGDQMACLTGMSVPQLACIGLLFYREDNGDGAVYQRDLEDCFKLRRSTISSLLSTLEKKALLQRVSVPHDARLRRLVLTEQGRELGRKVIGHFTGLNDLLVADLDAEERKTLRSLLEKIERSLAARCP